MCMISMSVTFFLMYIMQASKELKLEINKSIKLEFAAQLGYYFRITKKVSCMHCHIMYVVIQNRAI